MRGILVVERGCAITRLPHRPPEDEEPITYYKRGASNVTHARMRMAEIVEVLARLGAGTAGGGDRRRSDGAREEDLSAQRVSVTLPRPSGASGLTPRFPAMASTSSWPGTTNRSVVSASGSECGERQRIRPARRLGTSEDGRPPAACGDGGQGRVHVDAHRAVRTDRQRRHVGAGQDERAVHEVRRRVGLGEEAARLLQLQRQLEGRREIEAS